MRFATASAIIVVAAFGAVPALAADLIIEAPAAPEVYAPVGSWEGAYVGASAGVVWGEVESTGLEFDPDFEAIDFDSAGGAVSLFAGYNWQLADAFVLGLEGEIGWNNLEFEADRLTTTGPWNYLTADWSAAVALRAGVVVTPEILAYGKVGASWTNFEAGEWGGTPTIDDGTVSAIQVGAGLEVMVTDNVFIRGEVAYNFGGDDVSVDYDGLVYSYEPDYGTAKVGIGFKF